jgi:hypothetical protein
MKTQTGNIPVMFNTDTIGPTDIIIPVNVVAGGGAGGTSSNFGSAFPGTGTAVGAKDSGGVNMQPLNLDAGGNLKIAGSFSSTPPSSNTSNVPAQTSVGTSSVSILAANASRKGCSVQNTGTTRILLGLGQTPTGTAYHVALPACGTSNDGSSPRWDGTISGVVWTGTINGIGSAGGGTVVVTELT